MGMHAYAWVHACAYMHMHAYACIHMHMQACICMHAPLAKANSTCSSGASSRNVFFTTSLTSERTPCCGEFGNDSDMGAGTFRLGIQRALCSTPSFLAAISSGIAAL